MTEQEYAQCARKFLVDSDREFEVGERQQASKMLYRAANEALIAIAVQRGWKHRTHRDMKLASHQLAKEYHEPFLASGFVTAEKFRDNSIYDDMEEYEIAVDRPAARGYVNRLLELLEG